MPQRYALKLSHFVRSKWLSLIGQGIYFADHFW